ncbi:hypothetical protein ACTXT7_012303 [Hymenolepis weldensis]
MPGTAKAHRRTALLPVSKKALSNDQFEYTVGSKCPPPSERLDFWCPLYWPNLTSAIGHSGHRVFKISDSDVSPGRLLNVYSARSSPVPASQLLQSSPSATLLQPSDRYRQSITITNSIVFLLALYSFIFSDPSI